MMTETLGTMPTEKWFSIFTFKFLNNLNLLTMAISLKISLLKLIYAMPAINSNWKQKFAVMAYALQHTQNLVISHCCFAEDSYKMYKDLNADD